MLDGFLRIAAATPDIRVADPHYNARQILAQIESARRTRLCWCSRSFASPATPAGICFSSPRCCGGGGGAGFSADGNGGGGHRLYRRPAGGHGSVLYNCAAVCQKGRLLGLVPRPISPPIRNSTRRGISALAMRRRLTSASPAKPPASAPICFSAARSCRVPVRCGNLRGFVGGLSAVAAAGRRGRSADRQSVGQRRGHRQRRLPPGSW